MPVIVNAILNEHQIIVDIVAFVQKGDFPRSRLGEKQRGKILAGWVSRKMRTIAQFAIRDTTGLDGEIGAAAQDNSQHRASFGSLRHSQIGLASVGSTLRNVEPAPQILEQRELESQMEHMGALPPGPGHGSHDSRDGQTPTGPRASHPDEHEGFDLPDFSRFEDDDDTPPGVGAKPSHHHHHQGGAPEIRLAEVDWRGHAVPQHHGGGMHVRNPSIQHDEDWSAEAMGRLGLGGSNGDGNGDAIGRGY